MDIYIYIHIYIKRKRTVYQHTTNTIPTDYQQSSNRVPKQNQQQRRPSQAGKGAAGGILLVLC